jgi:hypothetical protein
MGTQFFWFYDVLLVAIFLGLVYKCTRQGFAGGIVSFAGSLLAFVIALGISAPLSAHIYDTFVAPGVSDKITYTRNVAMPENSAAIAFGTLRGIDMNKAVINNQSIDKLEYTVDSTGTVRLELKYVNLSETGIEDGDLYFFGLDAKYDFRGVSVGKIDISQADYAKYNLEDIILARTVSHRINERDKIKHNNLQNNLIETVPGVTRASAGSIDLVSVLIINILVNDSDTLEGAIDSYLVRPVLVTTFRVLCFAIIFAIVCLAVSFVANAMHLISEVPVIGKVNTLLGTLLGVFSSVVAVFIVCIAIKAIISLTGNNVIVLNTMTIDETYIFRHIYNIPFLKF